MFDTENILKEDIQFLREANEWLRSRMCELEEQLRVRGDSSRNPEDAYREDFGKYNSENWSDAQNRRRLDN